ncbi:hypothetical protein HETIRDRAFT_321513 [Heterobasidion irregulare TC 32-1]|uniref:Uncharacterized protein n=1 Tax=Heterobasidion irregulare (strain TC 32-1) TaxID=747525 RepID=W4K1E0_HETIT|nr:uncharacterized protein HETIRDRAFT_321513 [Heterobasidion irregulare TC 32-1]ETW79627.1 hypothetical protein HETIRDRAFT_321513 [Heterobasidion irregulare TC 32-1]
MSLKHTPNLIWANVPCHIDSSRRIIQDRPQIDGTEMMSDPEQSGSLSSESLLHEQPPFACQDARGPHPTSSQPSVTTASRLVPCQPFASRKLPRPPTALARITEAERCLRYQDRLDFHARSLIWLRAHGAVHSSVKLSPCIGTLLSGEQEAALLKTESLEALSRSMEQWEQESRAMKGALQADGNFE